MGYRSVLITEDSHEWSDGFISKYGEYFNVTKRGTLASFAEKKLYDNKIFVDIQKEVFGRNPDRMCCFCCVVLSEDGIVTKISIYDNKIEYLHFHDEDGLEVDGVWCNGLYTSD